MTKLKNCPFCGRRASIIETDGNIEVACHNCNCWIVNIGNNDNAIKQWNTRYDDWQPIETAPKDGNDILIYVKETKEQMVVFWATSIDTGDSDWVIARAKDGTCFICKDPTYWKPLPQPPQESE